MPLEALAMYVILPTQQIVRAFRENLLAMESLDWDLEQLITVVIGCLLSDKFDRNSNAIPMTYQTGQVITEALISLPMVTGLSEDDREVLRLAMIWFAENMDRCLIQHGVLDRHYGRLSFYQLVDDDIVLSTYHPLTAIT